MAGDLTKWSSPDIPKTDGNDVKFRRKGGWFITKKMLIFLLILILLLLFAAIVVTKLLTERQYTHETETNTTDSEFSPVISLSGDVIPIRYELKLSPYLDIAPLNKQLYTLYGECWIYFIVRKPTSTVSLNYAGSFVKYSNAIKKENQTLYVKSDKYIKYLEWYSVEFEENLMPNTNYSLLLTFRNDINDDQRGFYRASYRTADGEKWFGATDLEPTNARRLFPCFDDPRFRTTFDITVHRLRNVSVLSSTNKQYSISDLENSDWMWDTFERTPSMPSHKVGIVIGDLTVSKIYIENVTLSIWARADLFNSSINLIDLTSSLMRYYMSYFTMVQPIKKLDLVAIPDCINTDSSAWGLVLFSESLIFAEKNTRTEYLFALEIGKKIVEQWFGNLISIKWWKDLWIMKSISVYMAYQAVDKVRPNYQIMSNFIADVFQKGLDHESYPYSNEININSDIEDNSISHSELKGASLLHMIASVLSTKDIQEGINNFLGERYLKVSTAKQLWESFDNTYKTNNFNFMEFIEPWLKSGYPMINCQYDKQNNQVIIYQQPFYLQHPPSDNSLWNVPVRYTSEKMMPKEMPKNIWLFKNYTVVKFVLNTNDSWILLNVPKNDGLFGFFRVNYDINNWNSLVNNLTSLTIPWIKELKALLLDDSFQLSKSGRLSYDVPLNLSRGAVVNETNYLPYLTLDAHLSYLEKFLHENDSFKNFTYQIFQPMFKIFTNSIDSDDSLPRNELKLLTLKWICKFNQSECSNLFDAAFQTWMQDVDFIAANPGTGYSKLGPLAEIILKTGIRHGTVDDLEILLNRSLSRGQFSPEERLQFMHVLISSSTNVSFIINLFEIWLQDTELKGSKLLNNEEVIRMWQSVSENLVMKEEIFNFFLDHWNDIYNKYHSNHRVLKAIIDGATTNLNQENDLLELASLNDNFIHEYKFSLQSLQTAVDRLIVKSAWRADKLKVILSHLQQSNF